MSRITDMIQLSEILRRLRDGDGTNRIHRELGSHKTVIKRLRELADEQGWIDPATPLPDERIIQEKYRSLFASREQVHPLDSYKADIQKWREDGESFVVIRHKLKERLCGEGIKDTALRNYVHRNFPELPKPVMRRAAEHGIAELDFGYLGKTMDADGRMRKTWFVSVRFRASRHAWREILFKTNLRSVIRSIQNAFHFFGGVPPVLVIDNFKAAIQKAHLYDPTVTKGFYEFAKYAGFLLSPCKPYTPEHKGGVENDVKYVKNNFLPLLRDYEKQRGFETIRAEVINERFAWWNREIAMVRKIREAGNTPVADLFEHDFAVLKPLPLTDYQIIEWATVQVRKDWHVQYETNYYSVPYKCIGKKAEIRVSFDHIEVYENHELVARHARCHDRGKKITVNEHGPQAAIDYLETHRPGILKKAGIIGPKTLELVSCLLDDPVVDRMRSARGIVFLTKKYPETRIEKACERALFFSVPHYHNVKSILEKDLDKEPLEHPVDANGQFHFRFTRDRRLYN